jgi:nucleoside-diphosphate-sugar epimerase
MAAVICFGLGYSARHWAAGFGHAVDRIVGTVRSPQRAVAPVATPRGATAVETIVFDGVTPSQELRARLDEASVVLVSAPPGASGDPVLAAFGGTLPARRLELVIYLSTVGVYGDHAGGVVDEATPPRPASARSRVRLAAEQAWQRLGSQAELPVAVLRLAGIYGPGQNALVSLQEGRARRVVKPGQVFNRIHVADIGQAIAAAIAQKAHGVFNVADDEPSPPQDVIAFAARLLGIEPPPEIPFAEAAGDMSPMALSFYDENKRVLNRRLAGELGVLLRYPTYREGLRALHAEM